MLENGVAKPHSMHQENQNTYKFRLENTRGRGMPRWEDAIQVGNTDITVMWTGLR
jgi:hypothetical protein